MQQARIADTILDFDAPAAGGLLFAEDFDQPPQPDNPPEPEVIEPTFSATELEAVRTEAWQASRAETLTEAANADHAVVRQTVAAIQVQLATAREVATQIATQSAEAVARLLLDGLALTLPALCARYGDDEVAAVVAAVLPALTQEPAITVRVNPLHAPAVTRDIERLDPDLAARTRIVAVETMAPGDVRVVWRNGSASRDTAALWNEVAEALAAVGLLPTPDAPEHEEIDDAG